LADRMVSNCGNKDHCQETGNEELNKPVIKGLLLLAMTIAVVGVAFFLQSGSGRSGSGTTEITRPVSTTAVPGADSSGAASQLFDPAATTTAPVVNTSIQFLDATDASGISFVHLPNRSADRYMPEVYGSGVLIADFNRDGAPDMVLVNGGSMTDPHVRPADAGNRLYLNDGKGKFTDATEQWKLPGKAYGMGGAVGDYDNDGRVDLYLTTYGGGDQLLRNMGDHFEDVTESSGLNPDQMWSTSAGFLDADNDGDLDLYVVRYVNYTKANALKCYFVTAQVYCGPLLYAGVPDRFWLNNGDGTFRDVSSQNLLINSLPVASTVPQSAADTGVAPASAPELDFNACKGLALSIGDLNDDGFTDIYVANDQSRNMLLINRGNGVFDETGRTSGVAYGEMGEEQAGMGIDLNDIDDNGKVDIACANFQGEPVNIYCQTTGMFFVDRGDSLGFGQASRARLKFGVKFLDANNDGVMELLIANGHIYDNVDLFLKDGSFAQTNTLFEPVGKGKYADISSAAGNALQDAQVSRGLAIADFDGDGGIDFVVSNNGGTAQLAMNQSGKRGNFISLWLEGVQANRSAIGAKVTVKSRDKTIRREILGASSYLSASDLRMHVGLGSAEQADSVEIHWPGGQAQTVGPLAANHFYRIIEGSPPEAYVPGERTFQLPE